MQFGTILADPPWAYQKTSRHAKLSGYSDVEYNPLTTDDLCALPVGQLGTEESVLLLWTTWPFLPDALRVMSAWRYDYVTALPWIKTQQNDLNKPAYGVGYWFRGAAEPLLVGKRSASYRTNWTGLIAPGMAHSRKPDHAYDLANSFPGPRVELFARRTWPGWYSLGDELDGQDIRDSLPQYIDGTKLWTPAAEEVA